MIRNFKRLFVLITIASLACSSTGCQSTALSLSGLPPPPTYVYNKAVVPVLEGLYQEVGGEKAYYFTTYPKENWIYVYQKDRDSGPRRIRQGGPGVNEGMSRLRGYPFEFATTHRRGLEIKTDFSVYRKMTGSVPDDVRQSFAAQYESDSDPSNDYLRYAAGAAWVALLAKGAYTGVKQVGAAVGDAASRGAEAATRDEKAGKLDRWTCKWCKQTRIQRPTDPAPSPGNCPAKMTLLGGHEWVRRTF